MKPIRNQKTANGDTAKSCCILGSRTLQWEYECRTCHEAFKVDVPRGPTEERAIRCMKCNGKDLARINIPDLSGTPSGG